MSWTCTTCKLTMTKGSKESHLKGKKHRRRSGQSAIARSEGPSKRKRHARKSSKRRILVHTIVKAYSIAGHPIPLKGNRQGCMARRASASNGHGSAGAWHDMLIRGLVPREASVLTMVEKFDLLVL